MIANVHPHKSKGGNVLRLDPTRTTLLRRAFERDMAKRFYRVRRAVMEKVGESDGLGLVGPVISINFNPYHDDRGRFSDGPGGGAAPAVIADFAPGDRSFPTQSKKLTRSQTLRMEHKAFRILAPNGHTIPILTKLGIKHEVFRGMGSYGEVAGGIQVRILGKDGRDPDKVHFVGSLLADAMHQNAYVVDFHNEKGGTPVAGAAITKRDGTPFSREDAERVQKIINPEADRYGANFTASVDSKVLASLHFGSKEELRGFAKDLKEKLGSAQYRVVRYKGSSAYIESPGYRGNIRRGRDTLGPGRSSSLFDAADHSLHQSFRALYRSYGFHFDQQAHEASRQAPPPVMIVANFDPDEPRDIDGRWAAYGSALDTSMGLGRDTKEVYTGLKGAGPVHGEMVIKGKKFRGNVTHAGRGMVTVEGDEGYKGRHSFEGMTFRTDAQIQAREEVQKHLLSMTEIAKDLGLVGENFSPIYYGASGMKAIESVKKSTPSLRWEASGKSEALYFRFEADNGVTQQVRFARHHPVYAASSIGEQIESLEKLPEVVERLKVSPRLANVPGTEDVLKEAREAETRTGDRLRVEGSESEKKRARENHPTLNAPFVFETDDTKLKRFNKWLRDQINQGILEISPTTGEPKGMKPWMYKYIDSAYKKGVIRSYIDAHKVDLSQPQPYYEGTKEGFLQSAFGRPERVDKLKLLYTRTYEDLKGVTSHMSAVMSRTLADGMAKGDGPMKIARKMSDQISGITRQRARLIARTETIYAHSEGQLDSLEDLGVEEVGAEVEFHTAGDDGVCPECAELEGVVYSINDARGVIPVHPNCILGESIVQSPDPVALMKSWYSGTVVELVTANGCRVSVTEHHILLTQRGWVFAKDITDSDHLLDAFQFNRGKSSPRINQNDHPPTIEKTFESFVDVLGVASQPLVGPEAGEYLHGDGCFCHKEIQVVNLDGFLGYDVQSQLAGQFQKLPFVGRGWFLPKGMTFDGQRVLNLFLKGVVGAADGIMGGLGVPGMLLRRARGHHQPVRFPVISQNKPCVINASADDPAGHLKLLGNCVFTHPRLIHRNNSGYREVDLGARIGARNIGISADVQVNPTSFKDAGHIALEPSDFLSNLRRAFPTVVKLDKVVRVNSVICHNIPVYDVSTGSTAYILNGIISSNCRCAWIPVVP